MAGIAENIEVELAIIFEKALAIEFGRASFVERIKFRASGGRAILKSEALELARNTLRVAVMDGYSLAGRASAREHALALGRQQLDQLVSERASGAATFAEAYSYYCRLR